MENECPLDFHQDVPPVPIKTYQWEDLKRARDKGGYPWTHLKKPVLEGEISVEDVLRDFTPSRSESREVSRERSRTPTYSQMDGQKLLKLSSSPGSSRRHNEDGADAGAKIPNFSKEISTESEEDPIHRAVDKYIESEKCDIKNLNMSLQISQNIPRSISPKGILKRRLPDNHTKVKIYKSEKTKCCHPLVNKIKHITDKTLHKQGKSSSMSDLKKTKFNNDQQIKNLKSSPTAKRKKFAVMKLGSSDEVSKSFNDINHQLSNNYRENIYEDVDTANSTPRIDFTPEKLKQLTAPMKANHEKHSQAVNMIDKTNIDNLSVSSEDPSLSAEPFEEELKSNEHIMEAFHKHIDKEALVLDIDIDEEDKHLKLKDSPNITITEIEDDAADVSGDSEAVDKKVDCIPRNKNNDSIQSELISEWSKSSRMTTLRKWCSEGGTVTQKYTRPTSQDSVVSFSPDVQCACQFFRSSALLPERINPVGMISTPRPSTSNNLRLFLSDHEYELIGKPHPQFNNGNQTNDLKTNKNYIIGLNADQESCNQESMDDGEGLTEEERLIIQTIKDKMALCENGEDESVAEILQKDIEERFFMNTPSSLSRTECEISTSQVDSSALENLPLRRESRAKQADEIDNTLQQRFKEQTVKLRNQADKLKNKLQTLRTRQFSVPDRSRFHLPERPKLNFPEMPKFLLPEKRKFSLPERSKAKKNYAPEKSETTEKKKISFPDRPKFSMPDLPKFRVPEKVRNFGKKKGHSVEIEPSSSITDCKNVADEFESSTYPRSFTARIKSNEKNSSSPTLNHPGTFGFDKSSKFETSHQTFSVPKNDETGEISQSSINFSPYPISCVQEDREIHISVLTRYQNVETAKSLPDVSSTISECPHLINEINNDEFFVRPKGISRENIQMRQYLNDDIREAFKMPLNALEAIGHDPRDTKINSNDEYDADPDIYLDETNTVTRVESMQNDDGYYTFPPIRPNRKNRSKVDTFCMGGSLSNSTEHNLGHIEHEQVLQQSHSNGNLNTDEEIGNRLDFHTLPMVPKRRRKHQRFDSIQRTLSDFKVHDNSKPPNDDYAGDVIVYRTEHEYTVPDPIRFMDFERSSPVPPRRNRMKSRSSHITDEDRTSHGAESLASDPQICSQDNDSIVFRQSRRESPGYATVEKSPVTRLPRRSKSKTPPVRRRKSYSNDQKYFTVDRISRNSLPNRPPRKKTSTSLTTLNRYHKNTSDITQYVEIEDSSSTQKHLFSGATINKMKDRPLPPPPRPPRFSKKEKSNNARNEEVSIKNHPINSDCISDGIVEVEVSTQTDPLPDDLDFELGVDETIDISISSSIRDEDDEFVIKTSLTKLTDSPRNSRPTSRSETSSKITDPKLTDLTNSRIGRSSPTVILVERRVSSPTRLNNSDVILTEASLTVQPIDLPAAHATKLLPSEYTNTYTNKDNDTIKSVVSEKSENHSLTKDSHKGQSNQSQNMVSKTEKYSVENESEENKFTGIELSSSVIDEIVRKFAEITTSAQTNIQNPHTDPQSSIRIEEETRSKSCLSSPEEEENCNEPTVDLSKNNGVPPQRPPPPELSPLLYSYLQDISVPPNSFYQLRIPRERTDTLDPQPPPSPTRRSKRKINEKMRHDQSSSDEQRVTTPRRTRFSRGTPEPTSVTEAGAQFIRACQNSLMRTVTNIFNALMSYISGSEDKKDVQMALVIFLVLIAGLIMFGLSDGRTVHHHHWEFFNPPDNNKI